MVWLVFFEDMGFLPKGRGSVFFEVCGKEERP